MATLSDQGFRYMSSPDRKEAKWIHPAEIEAFYKSWIDVTDLSDEETAEFFTEAIMTAPTNEEVRRWLGPKPPSK